MPERVRPAARMAGWTSTPSAGCSPTRGSGCWPRPTDAGADSLASQAALRRTASPERVAAAITQVQLRRRAEEKFGDLAERMYFTPEGLEQATRLPVATHRAARLRAADTATLIDLGCGIGGDLLAYARAGITCAGVDLDPVRVAVAVANLEALGLGGAVTVADATMVDTSPFDVAFADPGAPVGARAQLRRRRLDPAVGLRADASGPGLLREGRPRHPARPRARRRRGGVGQRPPRGQGGGALVLAAWPPPAAAPRSSATAGWRP